MRWARQIVVTVLAAIGAVTAAHAQAPDFGLGSLMGDSISADFVGLSKLYGDNTAFTAKLEFRAYDKTQKETSSMVAGFARLDDKLRLDVDIAQVKNSSLPSGAAALLKQINMDRPFVIFRADQGLCHFVFPGVQASLNKPLGKVESGDKKPKMEVTALGKETIDGHSCIKNKVVTTDEKGKPVEYTVWNATDLKNFPLQILTKEKNETGIFRHKEIKFAKPDAKQFELPADCAQYTDPKDLMQAVMMKLATEAATSASPNIPGATPDSEKEK